MGRFISLLSVLAFLLAVMGSAAKVSPMGYFVLFLIPVTIMCIFIRDFAPEE